MLEAQPGRGWAEPPPPTHGPQQSTIPPHTCTDRQKEEISERFARRFQLHGCQPLPEACSCVRHVPQLLRQHQPARCPAAQAPWGYGVGFDASIFLAGLAAHPWGPHACFIISSHPNWGAASSRAAVRVGDPGKVTFWDAPSTPEALRVLGRL